ACGIRSRSAALFSDLLEIALRVGNSRKHANLAGEYHRKHIDRRLWHVEHVGGDVRLHTPEVVIKDYDPANAKEAEGEESVDQDIGCSMRAIDVDEIETHR